MLDTSEQTEKTRKKVRLRSQPEVAALFEEQHHKKQNKQFKHTL